MACWKSRCNVHEQVFGIDAARTHNRCDKCKNRHRRPVRALVEHWTNIATEPLLWTSSTSEVHMPRAKLFDRSISTSMKTLRPGLAEDRGVAPTEAARAPQGIASDAGRSSARAQMQTRPGADGKRPRVTRDAGRLVSKTITRTNTNPPPSERSELPMTREATPAGASARVRRLARCPRWSKPVTHVIPPRRRVPAARISRSSPATS